MSSILDALKKLEAEKARHAEELELADQEAFQADTTGDELDGFVAEPKTAPVMVSPKTLVAGGVVFSIALVAISVAVSMAVVRSSVPKIPALESTPPAALHAAALPPAPTPAPEPVKVAVAPPAPTPAPEPVKVAVAPPAPTPEPEPEPLKVAVAPPAPTPEPEPVKVAVAPPVPQSAPLSEPALAEPVRVSVSTPPPVVAPPPPAIEATSAVGPVDLKKLPVLRSSERVRYGLENMRLNVLREAGDNRPHGLAIINLNKVYIGETIPGTRAKLIEVKSHGIGIEMIGSGERYYVPH